MKRLDGCAALITGASSGLGSEFARQLAPRAERLLLVARREAALLAVAEECRQMNPRLVVEVLVADLGNEAGRAGVVEWVAGRSVAPDVLINNAGLGDYGAFADAEPARLREQVEVNIGAVVYLTRALLPLLRRPAGVLNVSSLASTLPMPDLAVYAASKAFVTSWSEALTVELAGEGVTVSCVCPGPTPTSFGANARRPGGQDTNRDGQALLRVPPEKVVATGLRALEEGRACVFPGIGVTVAAHLFRWLPRSVMRVLLRRRHRAGV